MYLWPRMQYIKEPGAFLNKEIKDIWVAGMQVKLKFSTKTPSTLAVEGVF